MIAYKNGKITYLDRKGRHWYINDKYLARDWSISSLLNSVKNIQIKSIPQKEELKYLIEGFMVNGIKVVLRDKNNKIINAFMIGSSSLNAMGSYFKKEDGRIYLCEIKNFHGTPRKVFEFSPTDFRSVDLILNKKKNIEKIIVDYPHFKNESFILVKNGQKYDVTTLYDSPQAPSPLSQDLANAYYQQFDRVFGETYFPDFNRKYLLEQKPYARFTVIKENQDTIKLTMWPSETISGIKSVSDFVGDIKSNNEIPRLWVLTGDNEWINLQVNPNLGIFRGYSYFFK